MDGLEATRRIRAKHGNRFKIVALSAHAYPHDIRLARDAGVDGYLTKPFLPKDLLSMVKRHLAAA
jgi:CheY-like chemotaxis protein